MIIKLPFRPRFKDPMLREIKRMTCRTEKKGKPGDTFEVFGKRFVLTHVMRMRLGFVATDCFIQEGCTSDQDFIEVWTGIHPKAGFDPEQIVWAHCFREIK